MKIGPSKTFILGTGSSKDLFRRVETGDGLHGWRSLCHAQPRRKSSRMYRAMART